MTGAIVSENIATVAKQRYDTEIRPKVEATKRGQFLVMNVQSGDYVIHESHVQAVLDMLAQGHSGDDLFTLRIGYPTAHNIGGWPEDSER